MKKIKNVVKSIYEFTKSTAFFVALIPITAVMFVVSIRGIKEERA